MTNAATPSLFMVEVSQELMYQFRHFDRDFSILDLKAHRQGCRYVMETIKIFPQIPDNDLIVRISQKVADKGRVISLKRLLPQAN
jgi:hypothetical protein